MRASHFGPHGGLISSSQQGMGQHGGVWYNPLTWHSDIYNYVTRDYTPEEKVEATRNAEVALADRKATIDRGGRLASWKKYTYDAAYQFIVAKTLQLFVGTVMGVVLARNPDLMSKWVADVLVHAPDVIFHGMMRNNPINQMLLAYSYAWLPRQGISSVASNITTNVTSNISAIAANLTGQGGAGASRKRRRENSQDGSGIREMIAKRIFDLPPNDTRFQERYNNPNNPNNPNPNPNRCACLCLSVPACMTCVLVF